MRILVINHRDWMNPRAGGVEEVVYQTTTRWAAWGHDVRLLVSSFAGAKETDFKCEGVRIIRSGREELFNWIVPLCHRALLRDADVIVEHLSKVACMLPWFTRKPIVGYYYHLFGDSLFGNVFLPVAWYVRAMERLAVRVYGRCPAIVISKSTAAELEQYGMSADQMQVVYCGMNLKLFRPANPDHKTPHPSIVWVGRVRKTKGVTLALDAFELVARRLPEARLTIVGTGDFEGELRQMVQDRGLQDRVTMAGYLDIQQLCEQMQRAWVLAYPSPKEGWGLCVIEAGACGTPSVASNSPGLREAVRDGETGLLVPHGDIAALAEKLALVLTDAPLRQRLGAAAVQWANQFSWDDTARRALAVVESAYRFRATTPTDTTK